MAITPIMHPVSCHVLLQRVAASAEAQAVQLRSGLRDDVQSFIVSSSRLKGENREFIINAMDASPSCQQLRILRVLYTPLLASIDIVRAARRRQFVNGRRI